MDKSWFAAGGAIMHVPTLTQIIIGVLIVGGFYYFKRSLLKSNKQVLEMIQTGAKVVDVRSAGEFNAYHYDGAINIPVGNLAASLGKLGDKNSPIVVYCASGARSSAASMILKKNGYTNVVNGGGLGSMPVAEKRA